MKTSSQIRRLTAAALGAALVCIATRIFQIPIPLGYAHLGNSMILLFSYWCSPWTAAAAAGTGSALADLLSFPEWALPTLLIKSFMGLAASALMRAGSSSPSLRSLRVLLGSAAGILIMIAGYFLAGTVMYGSLASGAAQIPGLAAEGAAGIILFYVIAGALEAAGVRKHVQHQE